MADADAQIDKNARLAIAYGKHDVRGYRLNKRVDLVGNGKEIVLRYGLGLDEWDGCEGLYYRGNVIAPADFSFHPGGPVDVADSFFPGETYSGAPYTNARLRGAFAEDDNPDDVIGVYRTLKIANYDGNGQQIDSNGNPIPGGATPRDYYFYSASPAREMVDLIIRWGARKATTVHWPGWADWRDDCAELITWNDGTTVRQIPRFESHVFFMPPFRLSDAMRKIAQVCCAEWERASGKLYFLTPHARDPIFTFDLTKMPVGAFRTYPVDESKRFTKVMVYFRDLDTSLLIAAGKEGAAPVVEIEREIGADEEHKTLEVDIGCAYASQAQRVGEYLARVNCDLGVVAEFEGSPDSYSVLPASVVEISDAVPTWNGVQFKIFEKEETEDTKLGYPMVGMLYSPNCYSDTDHGAIERPLPPSNPDEFAAPPQVTDVTLEEKNVLQADAGIVTLIQVTAQFANYVNKKDYRARVFYKESSESWDDAKDGGTIKPHPDTLVGSVEIRGVKKTTYDVKVVPESNFAAADFAGATAYNIPITGKTTAPADVPDESFIVDPAPEQHIYSWTASPDDRQGEYEVYQSLSGHAPVPGTHYATGGVPSNLLYRGMAHSFSIPRANPNFAKTGAWIRFVDWSGNASRWLQAIYIDYTPGENLKPSISLDGATTTPYRVSLHVVPDADQDEYNITATRVQIRQQGGAWPSETDATDRQIVLPGLHREVSIGWLSGGAVEVRVRYDMTGAQWSDALLHTMDTVSGGTNADAVSYKGHAEPTGTEFSYLAGVTSSIQAQLNTKAPLASPALTGTPTAPTATAGTNTTQLATTAFVSTAIANLVASAPSTLDTLKELADALGDDPNFATTVSTALGNRLRVDTNAQGLTSTQKDNARTNLGLSVADNPVFAGLQISGLTASRLVLTDGSKNLVSMSAGTTGQYLRGDNSWQTLDTSVVPENGNLYYTDERVDDRVAALIQGTLNQITPTYNDGAGTLTLSLPQNIHSAATPTFAGLISNGASFNLINTTATTVNFAGAATALNIGAATGTATLNNASVNLAGTLLTPNVGYNTNIGQLSKKFLALHAAELWVETLVAQNTLATIGGRVLIGPTTPLIADVTPAATTIDVKYNNLASGDRVYLEANGQLEFMAITSAASVISGGYRYSVTRDLDGTGANQWYAGDAVFNTRQAGAGWIDLYSVQGVKGNSQLGPTIVGNIRNSATYNDWSEHWAIGNLYGLYNYGASNVYGAAFGKYANGSTFITVDSTNGYRIITRSSNTNTVIGQWDTSGNMALGQVANNSGNAYWNNTNKRLEFRGGAGGTQVQAYIDTTGAIAFGGGAGTLDANGLRIVPGQTSLSNVGWWSSENFYSGYIRNYLDTVTTPASSATVVQTSLGNHANGSAALNLSCTNDTGENTSLLLYSNGSNYGGSAANDYGYAQLYSTGQTFKGISIGSGTVPEAMLDIYKSDSVTNALTDVGILRHNSSGTPAANFGGSILFKLKSSTTADQDAARVGAIWTSATHASRTSAFTIQLVNNAGNLSEVFRVTGAGSVGIGTTNPQNALDVVRGAAGTMGKGTYEAASFEYNGDMKVGVYTSSSNTSSASSIMFGQTALTATGGVYPGFELQYVYNATPASNFMRINYVGRNSTGTVTSAVPDLFNVYASGSVVLNPTGGTPKLGIGKTPVYAVDVAGDVNVTGDVRKNGTAYTNPDYVLEHYFNGRVVRFADKEGAKDYNGLLPLTELKSFVRENLHLPGLGQTAGHGLFSGGDRVLLSVEEAYLYIFQLEDRIRALELRCLERSAT
jgi:hypothetical protein